MTGAKLALAQAARAVRMRAEKIDQRPDGLMDDWGGGEPTHWKLTLSRDVWIAGIQNGYVARRHRRTWTVYWSQGSAHGDTPPEVLDVLESLWLDVQGVEGRAFPNDPPIPCLEEHFRHWCEDYGFDTDSRKAGRVYKACVRAAQAWGRFWDGVEITSGDET